MLRYGNHQLCGRVAFIGDEKHTFVVDPHGRKVPSLEPAGVDEVAAVRVQDEHKLRGLGTCQSNQQVHVHRSLCLVSLLTFRLSSVSYEKSPKILVLFLLLLISPARLALVRRRQCTW